VSPIDALIDWLIDGAPGRVAPETLIERVGAALHAGGIPLDRLVAFIGALHPTIGGRRYRWSPRRPVATINYVPHGSLEEGGFLNSPVDAVVASKKELRARIGRGPAERPYPVLEKLASDGFVDYFILPLVFTNGETHGVSFATRAPDGFSEAHLADLRRLLRPLTRLVEIDVLRVRSTTLLNTYVGHNSGERILAGRIQKGDVETLRAVIWFSDLRGFTEMSSRVSPREVIATLNRVFECQVPAIEKHGGEVLKFIGDGLLAIFPLVQGAETGPVADHALDAAHVALDAMNSLAPLRIGIALHVGELAYGNIGGSNRLDFTAIGAAVNIAARLEALTGKLDRTLVVSDDVAGMTSRATEELGSYALKGVPAPVGVFAPRR
jgi:adenylate cyclase